MLKIFRVFAINTLVFLPGGHGFQFMKGWKMPTHDPYEEAIKEKFGDKKLVVITGASSGLGRKTALALLQTGEYHVIGAVRDLDKMEAVAEVDGFDLSSFTPMYCELNSLASVREFCEKVEEFRMSKPIDRLICNAGVYQPSLPYAKWSQDNMEQTMQINFLSHFLMVSSLMKSMMDSADPRVIMVGSVTGNDNTVGGGGVYPIADLHELDGLRVGFKNPVSMADGYGFIGAKAYKDSKLCLMMMSNFLHTKYHRLTGISFSSIYPGCIAESPLFREKREWFRTYFPIFMKFITGGFVSEHEAGQRLFQVAHDPRCAKSGVYWSWNGGPREGRGMAALEKGGQISGGGGAGGGWDSIYENDQSAKVLDVEIAMKLFQYSTEITGAEWPELKAIESPCPTLKVIGAVTKGMVKREELKRMRELGRPGISDLSVAAVPVTQTATPALTSPVEPELITCDPIDGVVLADADAASPVRPSKASRRARVAMAADRVVSFTLRNSVGRVARFAGSRLLGKIPEEALQGSYDSNDSSDSAITVPSEVVEHGNSLESLEDSQRLLDGEVAEQLLMTHGDLIEELQVTHEKVPIAVVDRDDEALFEQIYNDDSTPAPKTRDVVASNN